MKLRSGKGLSIVGYVLTITLMNYGVSATEFTELLEDYDGWWNETTLAQEASEGYEMPYWLKVCWWTLFIPFTVTGVVGNTVVVLTEFRNPISKSGSRCFLAQMCISDAIASIVFLFPFFVQEISVNWPFGPIFCGIMMVSSAPLLFTSMFSIAALALERFLSFIRPSKLPMATCFAWKVIVSIWIFGVLLSVPDWLFHKVSSIEYFGRNISFCHTEWPEVLDKQRHVFDIVLDICLRIVLRLVPVILIGYVYVKMSQLQSHNRSTEQNIQLVPSNIQENGKMFHMTDILVFGFAACELPFLFKDLHVCISGTYYGHTNLLLLSVWLGSCKAMICPITYFRLYKRHRDELRQNNCSNRDSRSYLQPQNETGEYSTSSI